MAEEIEPYEARKYRVDPEMKKITGHDTLAEWAAYDLGREHMERVMIQFVEEWDGSTNSHFGELLMKKTKEIHDKTGDNTTVSNN